LSWDKAYNIIIGQTPPEDSPELRNSYIENVLGDIEGNKVIQHRFHKEIQGTIFRWEQEGINDGVISAPYGGGKSQQVPIGLSTYKATRSPEKPHIIISANPMLAKNRINSIRLIFESEQYKYWCKQHHFRPAEYARGDTGSSELIVLKSNNRTGVPTFFGSGISTKGTGWRSYYLWGDDICDNEDFKSKAVREERFKGWTNTWTKRTLDGGFEILIRTPYHPQDANERLIKTGIYAHLEIAVKEDKSGYDLKEWIPKDGELKLIREEEFELWDVNHSKEKLEKEEAKDYAAYQLGFRMLKEVQDPTRGAYKNFSELNYPLGNVHNVEFDWASRNPLELTCDFNRKPQAWALGQLQKIEGIERYCWIEEIISEDALTEEQAHKAAKKIMEMGHTEVVLYGDGTGNQGGQRYGRSGENDWNTVKRVLTEYGIRYRMKVKKSNPLRAERVKVVNNVIYSVVMGEEIRRMLISPRCKGIIEDYKYASIDDNGEKRKDQGDRGHISDACDYRIYAGETKTTHGYLIK